MKKIIFWFLFLSSALLYSSCSDQLEQEPINAVTYKNYYKTAKDVETLVDGLHQDYRNTFGDVIMIYRMRGLPAEFDFINKGIWDAQTTNRLQTLGSDDLKFDWTSIYDLIVEANAIIDNIGRAEMSEEQKNYLLGQATCIRAICYKYLLQTWGGVPLVISYTDNQAFARSSEEEIADFCITELLKAAEMLSPASRLTDINGNPVTNKQYFSQGSVYTLLADLYAWEASLHNKPELRKKAIEMATKVIESGEYRLVDNWNEVRQVVLMGGSAESIIDLHYPNTILDYRLSGSCMAGVIQRWPIQPLTTANTRRMNLRINNKTVYSRYPNPNDGRRDNYYKLDSMAAQPVGKTQGAAYVLKWIHRILGVGGSDDGRLIGYKANQIIYRLPSLILLRAELYAQEGETAKAIADLHTIQKRAGGNLYTAADGDLLRAILTERIRELWGETDIYYDIVRMKLFRETLAGDFKTLTDQDVADGALYYPVSSQARRKNPKIRQTTYWLRKNL